MTAEEDLTSSNSTPAKALKRELYTWQNGVRLLIAVAVLSLLARIVDWHEFARIASGARPELLVLATAMMAVEILMVSARWKMLLSPVGVHVSFMQALRSYMKGHMVGYFVPASVAADVVKAVDVNMARERGSASKGVEVVSSIFIERGFGAITVAVAVLLGLAISPLAGQNADLGRLLTLAALAVIVCCIAALFADKFLGLVPVGLLRRMPRVHSMVDRAQDSMVAYRRKPLVLAGLMLFSFAIQAMRVVPVYMLAVAIGAGDAFFAYLIAVPVIFMVNTIPVVGSRIGTEQGLFVLFLGFAGVHPESALVVALLKLVLGILVSLPGAYWLIQGRSPHAQS
jgi:glycosyltransferase 2 family protein